MVQNRQIGFEIKTISNLIKRELNQQAFQNASEAMTGMQGWLVRYLYQRREEDVFQRDLEREFHIRRSTVTGILQGMEKNGLIRRTPVKSDARLKKIVLTDKAVSMHEAIAMEIVRMEDRLKQGLSQQELATLFALLDRIKANLEG